MVVWSTLTLQLLWILKFFKSVLFEQGAAQSALLTTGRLLVTAASGKH